MAKNAKGGLGDSIRRARKRSQMTQSELASALGVSQNVVARLESGGRPDPRLSTLTRLAKALAVSIDEVAGDGGGSTRASRRAPDVAAALGYIRRIRRAVSDLESALAELESVLSGTAPRTRR